MKALSIRQPWAWAIVHGVKDIENRTWPTKVRGTVLVHTGKRYDKNALAWFAARNMDLPEDQPMGGIIGSVEIVDCVTESDSVWFEGPYGFVLANPRVLTFVPYRGALGFFDGPDEPVT